MTARRNEHQNYVLPNGLLIQRPIVRRGLWTIWRKSELLGGEKTLKAAKRIAERTNERDE